MASSSEKAEAASAAETAERLAATLDHSFARPKLLAEALTHSSAATSRKRRGRGGGALRAYERLEFLGDRVLGLVVAEMLWRHFPDESEGALTRRLTQLVRRETLAEVAREAELGAHIRLSAGEETAMIRDNESLLADICEAVIAALYVDGGLEAASRFVHRHWTARLEAASEPPQDPKTALQEWAQARGRVPRYEIVAVEGPPHRRIFTATVSIKGEEAATGIGSSKRAAETSAAAALLARVGNGGATP